MNRKLIVIAVLAPVVVGVALVLYAWPAARTHPRDVPVGVVAAPGRVDELAGKLQGQGGAFGVERYDDVAAARDAIRERQVDAAVVTTTDPPTVLVASAAGPALAMQITPMLRDVADGVAVDTAVVEDVVATPSTDPKGSVLGQAVLPLTLAGQLSGIMLALAVRPGFRQLGVLTVVSALTGLIGYLVAGAWLDVLGPATWWLAAGAFGFTVLAVGAIVLGLHALLGRAGLPVAFASLVFLGNAFAGTSSAPELLPTVPRRVGQWLPPGAGNELLRSVSFFHGHGATHPVVVLGVWVVLGFAAVGVGRVLAERRTRAGRHERDGARPATQPAAG